MRASPAFQISLQEFGVWRVAVTALSLVSAATLSAWLVLTERPLDATVSGLGALTLVALAVAARTLLRTPPIAMRWDGHSWFVGRGSSEPIAGTLSPALDLGPWMLLRFEPLGSGVMKAATVWIPVQRRGTGSQWHTLRCALHSPHAAPADTPPAVR